MLKRVYIDNYKCFANFEIEFGQINLILGANGSGKTVLFEVIRRLRNLLTNRAEVEDLFPHSSLTRWDKRLIQTFEMELEGNGGTYLYHLEIEHNQEPGRIKEEKLYFDRDILFSFEKGFVQLWQDGRGKAPYKAGPSYETYWGASALAFRTPHADNSLLTWFKDHVKSLNVLRIDPISIEARSEKEEGQPQENLSNFSSWYRHLTQENTGKLNDFFKDLQAIGFKSLSLKADGEKIRLLHVEQITETGKTISYTFEELSDGQRVLIALYAILHFGMVENSIFCLDEPEAYVGLREIQPWLMELQDVCMTNRSQVLLISHHPEIIDQLATGEGLRLSRPNNGPVRAAKWVSHDETGLRPSEIIARGDDEE
ncbi:MAG: ATP-binding protein [Acidobacteriota bacterium]|nr:ATP-binding protein [Acidobacteriota bacterium]